MNGSSRPRFALAATLLAALIALGSVASPALAAPSGKGKPGGGGGNAQLAYAALGDSYAAGLGAGSYLETNCYTSSKGYPALLDADANLALAARPACRGATTADVISKQVPALPTNAVRVSLTVGGNDVGFANVMQNCFVLVNSTCETHIVAGETMVQNGVLAQNVRNAIAAIKAKASNARVVVTGYPLLFAPTSRYQWATRVNTGTVALNDAIEGAAVLAGAVYVDVEAPFTGHGIGSSAPWINDWSWLRSNDSFHATAAGYQAFAAALRPALK
ncbi:lysophospholipase L1-like esterase [Agromyces hippuratus]|uniref:Lysophospholipase L1-like esterase n=1 Tax=Agromyces hippuratus TaxID=286438 RepID=A0A852WRQ8_9MICO|nr:SGNH/GDSL hydrolase family protein [Agromyces hippuratus]NYG20639.1 lysophospholipase L1-like esterase [Agromyces hippuratus]